MEIKQHDIQKHEVNSIYRQVNVCSGKDGDRFVGFKADSDKINVFFPIGYDIPADDESQVRKDIRNLFSVMADSIRGGIADRSNSLNHYVVNFPIKSYFIVINHYIEKGYYVEKEKVFQKASRGNIDWKRTVRDNRVIVHEDCSPIYTEFTVKKMTPNNDGKIRHINEYCVYEAFSKLYFVYHSNNPVSSTKKLLISNREARAILSNALASTHDDTKQSLFRAMRDMLDFLDERNENMRYTFGTDEFEYVWQSIIDIAFGIREKDEYFPKAKWNLRYGCIKEKNPLQPDSIMIYNNKVYVLDAKYYRYGITGISDHLPNSSDINKQITYGEYAAKIAKEKNNDSVFNAFVMPYSKSANCFNAGREFADIGFAEGLWKDGIHEYEKIRGILVDTRYLLFHYRDSGNENKKLLSECIEGGLT